MVFLQERQLNHRMCAASAVLQECDFVRYRRSAHTSASSDLLNHSKERDDP